MPPSSNGCLPVQKRKIKMCRLSSMVVRQQSKGRTHERARTSSGLPPLHTLAFAPLRSACWICHSWVWRLGVASMRNTWLDRVRSKRSRFVWMFTYSQVTPNATSELGANHRPVRPTEPGSLFFSPIRWRSMCARTVPSASSTRAKLTTIPSL